jgi:hypothetical protein
MTQDNDSTKFDAKDYPESPWLAMHMSVSVDNELVDAAAARQCMALACQTKVLTVGNIRTALEADIIPVLQESLLFTGLHIEYRAVCNDKNGHNLLGGLPIGEPIETAQFDTLQAVYASNLLDFCAWAKVCLDIFSQSPAVRLQIKNRWIGKTGYVWIDGDSATASFYLPASAADEFVCGMGSIERTEVNSKDLGILDWGKMQSAIAKRFSVSLEDVQNSNLDDDDCWTETNFSATITVNNIPEFAVPDIPKVKVLVSNLEKIYLGERQYDERSIEYRVENGMPTGYPKYFLDALRGVAYMEFYTSQQYNNLQMLFSNGKLTALRIGNLGIEDNGVPVAILCDPTDGILDCNTNFSSDPDGGSAYDMKANVKPVQLASVIDLPSLGYGAYGDLANKMFVLFKDVVMPKTLLCLQKFVSDAINGPAEESPEQVEIAISEEERQRLAEEVAREGNYQKYIAQHFNAEEKMREKERDLHYRVRPQVY